MAVMLGLLAAFTLFFVFTGAYSFKKADTWLLHDTYLRAVMFSMPLAVAALVIARGSWQKTRALSLSFGRGLNQLRFEKGLFVILKSSVLEMSFIGESGGQFTIKNFIDLEELRF